MNKKSKLLLILLISLTLPACSNEEVDKKLVKEYEAVEYIDNTLILVKKLMYQL